MTSQVEVDELSAKRLCHYCVGEKFPKAEIRAEGRCGRCSYCARPGSKSYTIGDLENRIEEIFETHYVRTSDHPNSWKVTMLSDRGPAAIERRLLDQLAADYMRPERPSWAACVRRVKVFAESHGVAIPHARTLWRRLCKLYDGPMIALYRDEPLPVWLLRRFAANDR